MLLSNVIVMLSNKPSTIQLYRYKFVQYALLQLCIYVHCLYKIQYSKWFTYFTHFVAVTVSVFCSEGENARDCPQARQHFIHYQTTCLSSACEIIFFKSWTAVSCCVVLPPL
jgi:hypothetical protein